MRYISLIFTGILLIVLVPMSTFANGIVDFVVPWASGGTLSYSGGANPLVGQDIRISAIFGFGGTRHNFHGVHVRDGLLDFTSGSSTGPGTWGPGGSLTATGEIGSFSGTLLQGTFSDIYLRPVRPGWLELDLGTFSGSISSGLSAFYGFPNTPVDGSLKLLAFRDVPPGQAFGKAPVLKGTIQTVDAAEGGGLAATLCLLVSAGLCLGLGVRVKAFKLTA